MHDPFDLAPAAFAGLARAVIDVKAVLEIAERAIGGGKVGDRRSARLNRLGNHVVDRRGEARRALAGNGLESRLGEIPDRNSASQT